jgi:WG containing repeat
MNLRNRVFSALYVCILFSCSESTNEYLIKVYELPGERGAAGYINTKGDTVIAMGKYIRCYTDTIKSFGVVMKEDNRLIGIDKNEKELFEVFWFDNGPDYISDGLLRIVKNGKIGYADETGKIVIEPHYDCAYPFENGKAKVSKNCITVQDREHSTWESDHWEVIHKAGK